MEDAGFAVLEKRRVAQLVPQGLEPVGMVEILVVAVGDLEPQRMARRNPAAGDG